MRCAGSLLLVLALASAAPALANSASAEASFERGRSLLKAGDTRAACAAFDDSLRDDFQFGTLYNLAGCYEKLGKLGSAWRMYKRLSDEDTNPGRRERSWELAQRLWPRVPKLIVDVAKPPAGLVVRLDDEDIAAKIKQEVAVDPGEHVVVATAPGYRERRATAKVDTKSAEVRVAIELQREDAPVSEPTQPEVTQYKRTRNGHRTAATWFAIGGIAALGGSAAVSFWAKSKFDDAVERIENYGPGTYEQNAATAKHYLRIARYVATPISIAGAASLAAGVVLYTRSDTITLTPIASSNGGGVVLSGSF